MHKSGHSERKKRILSALLSVVMVWSLLPPMTLPARAAGETFTFSSGAVLLDASYSGDNVIIQNGVFSVAVNGAQDVTIIFDGTLDKTGGPQGGPDGVPDGITIDRRYSSEIKSTGANGDTIKDLYDVSLALGWGTTAQTCPFLITGNSTVTASFRGNCTFYAGTNECRLTSGEQYTAVATGAGFAGIQVDSGSTLTIAHAENLKVYGAHQLASPDPATGKVTANGTTEDYSDVLRGNKDIIVDGQYIYNDPWDSVYQVPSGAEVNTKSGGAGIGGGATYNTSKNGGVSSGNSAYTAGTPGTIIIEGGNIEAFGGHQAAGIGGGTNSSATADKIVINGGNVIAHGGRWSAGIGDGDSISGNASNTYDDKCLIEINGGTVTAYGGVASPGIGSTDEFSTNGLEIAINGGTVNAFSGFPHNFEGSSSYSNSEAPAAIGAGSKSKMAANSIYVSSAADLSCAGFGNYSLTEDGTDATVVPTINIDSDGYLLLLRTEEYYSSEERELVLYYPQRIVHPETGANCIIYEDQETGQIFYVDQDHDLVYDETFEYVSSEDLNGHRITLYVDENSEEILRLNLAYFFRSIALTLPDPEKYGGLYALAVPADGINSGAETPMDGKDIILTIEAHTQGTQSGYIDYPTTHNLGKDAASAAFTDLDVNGNATTNGLIGDSFLPEVYAYTVYVEPDTTTANLYFAFEQEAGFSYTITADNATNLKYTTATADGKTLRRYTATVNMSGENERVVRIKKNDQGLAAVSYKVTIIRKGDYKLDLTDPSKIYDGEPAKSVVSMAYTGEYIQSFDVKEVLLSGSGGSEGTLSGQQTVDATSGNSVFYCASNSKLNLGTSVVVQKTSDPNTLHYILTVVPSVNTGYFQNLKTCQVGWAVTYNETTGKVSCTQLTENPDPSSGTTWATGSTVALGNVYNSNDVNLIVNTTGTGGTVTISYTRFATKTGTVFRFTLKNVKVTPGENTKGTAQQEAEAAAQNGLVGQRFEYTQETDCSWEHDLTLNQFDGKSNNDVDVDSTVSGSGSYQYSTSITGYYEVVSSDSGDATQVMVPEEDLKNAVLTYYRVETNGSLTQLDGPPTDVGTYRVEATLRTQTYNAAGYRVFTVSKRPVTVLQIENWLKYMTSADVNDLTGTTLAITTPGAIMLNNVVSGDTVTVTAASVYYNDISVSYGSDKITLEGVTLGGEDAHNYTTESTQTVFGQIAYDMQGAIFRKTETGNWRKYYPVDSQYPIGHASGPAADYHSPATGGLYLSHVEYVKARTVNKGERGARYAVDIEYGAMQFNFYRSVWDVNTLTYKEMTTSYWGGMDDTNNKITVSNYSNKNIWYRMDDEIDFMYADHYSTGTGITAKITSNATGTTVVEKTVWSPVAAATVGSSAEQGQATTSDRYLILSGVPQMPENIPITVGAITILVSPTDPNSA